MIVTGGRDKSIQDSLPTDVYDTETSEWRKFPAVGLFRHSCFIKENSLFIHGGFENKNPNLTIQTLNKIDLLSFFSSSTTIINKINSYFSSNTKEKEKEKDIKEIDKKTNNQLNINNSVNYLNQGKFVSNNNGLVQQNNSTIINQNYLNHLNNNNFSNQYNNNNILNQLLEKDSNQSGLMDNNQKNQTFLISNQAVVIQACDDMDDSSTYMRKVDIDKLNQESKRIGPEYLRYKVQQKRIYNEEVINKFIDLLLRPFDWQNSNEMEQIHNQLPFNKDEVDVLLKEVARIIHKEKTLINLRSPVKVFGNLFGQYYDLMRFFEAFGNPSDTNPMGDINITTYLFLGDYVDRGHYSLEVIFLLFALKVRYPESIILLRGHHEDENINKKLGLFEDCEKRFSDPLLFSKLNAIFDILPLAATIDNKILCCHGGIGSRVNSLADISKIQRPLSVFQEVKTPDQQIIIDLLYSEYCEDIQEVSTNEDRDTQKFGYITKFGKDRLAKFLNDNNLSLLLTSHSWVNEGVKAYNNEKIVIIYSCTSYMDKASNIGGILNVTKNCNHIIPKLIDNIKIEKKMFKNIKNSNNSPVRYKKLG